MPSTRVYFYDIALRNQLPLIQVAYGPLKVPLDLAEHHEGTQVCICSEEMTVCFVYELMNETGRLEQKCKECGMQTGA
jgi:hypothetical protein